MDTRKILYISHEKSFGGATKALISLIKESIKSGYEIYVLVPKKECVATNKIRETGANIISFPYSWWEVPQKASSIVKFIFKIIYRLNWFMLIIYIKKIPNVDIIHSNSSVIDIGAKIANKLDKPHVWHFREFYENNLSFIKDVKSSYKYINNSNSKIIYVSNDIKEYYSKYIDLNISTVIYDGIEIRNCRKYIINNYITFLIAGSIQESKGQEIAIYAIDELIKRGYHNFKVIFAGGDPEGYQEKLEQLTEQKKLNDYVEFIGFVNDMNLLRQKVDVELICSHREAFGLCTAEALMFGNLVIGSDSGATAELIDDDKTGILFSKGDHIDLANKLEQVLKDTKIIAKLGKNGHDSAKMNFSEKRNFEQINIIYKNIFNKKG